VGRQKIDSADHVTPDYRTNINVIVGEHACKRILMPGDHTKRATKALLGISIHRQRPTPLT